VPLIFAHFSVPISRMSLPGGHFKCIQRYRFVSNDEEDRIECWSAANGEERAMLRPFRSQPRYPTIFWHRALIIMFLALGVISSFQDFIVCIYWVSAIVPPPDEASEGSVAFIGSSKPQRMPNYRRFFVPFSRNFLPEGRFLSNKRHQRVRSDEEDSLER